MMTSSAVFAANQSPAAQDYRMPAEWERHLATWLSWPHNTETWPDELAEVEAVMAMAVRHLATGEAVFINVLNTQHQRHVEAVLDEAGARGDIRFFHVPTNDAWIRDHGAIFVRNGEGDLVATSWTFNSWGEKYPPWDLDDAVPEKMASILDVPSFGGNMVLEGGAIEVNGAGVLITTESCLLNPNRNPHLDRPAIELRLRETLGVNSVIWLGEGIAGDDTDGHVDDITRFVDSTTIVTVVEEDRDDANFEPLRENLEMLRSAEGGSFRIIELPMPRPLHAKGERMPASYANFYIGNEVVLMPAFDDPADAVAADVLKRCFPTREIIPLDCRALIWGLGAFHCLTQQVPHHALRKMK